MPRLSPIATTSAGRLCRRCGYGLRGIGDDTRACPECGLPVFFSFRDHDGLDVAAPPWLARMAAGVACLAVAQFLFPLALIAVLAGDITAGDLLATFTQNEDARTAPVLEFLSMRLVAAGMLLLLSVAAFMLIGLEPSAHPALRKQLRSRRVIAALPGVMACVVIVTTVLFWQTDRPIGSFVLGIPAWGLCWLIVTRLLKARPALSLRRWVVRSLWAIAVLPILVIAPNLPWWSKVAAATVVWIAPVVMAGLVVRVLLKLRRTAINEWTSAERAFADRPAAAPKRVSAPP